MAGQQGVEAAYESLLLSEELQAQAITWLQTPDWQTSQTYLQNHHQLLTDAAEQAMEELKLTQREQLAHAIIDLHQDLLQKARLAHVLGTSLNDQEVSTHNALPHPATLNDAGMAAFHQYLTSRQAPI